MSPLFYRGNAHYLPLLQLMSTLASTVTDNGDWFISLIRSYITWDQRSDLLFLLYLPELRIEPQAQTGRKPIADLIQLSTRRMTNQRFRSCAPRVPEGPPEPRQIKALVMITVSCYLPFSPSSSHECASEFYRGCVTGDITTDWMQKRV